MSTRDNVNNQKFLQSLAPQTISGSAINTGNIDLDGFDSAAFVVGLGTVDGLNSGSPSAGTIAVLVEHAADDGTGSPGSYAAVADTDLVGATQSSGVVNTFSESNATSPFKFGYAGKNRFVRITLTPTGLGAGGPVQISSVLGHPHLSPVT